MRVDRWNGSARSARFPCASRPDTHIRQLVAPGGLPPVHSRLIRAERVPARSARPTSSRAYPLSAHLGVLLCQRLLTSSSKHSAHERVMSLARACVENSTLFGETR